MDSENKMSDTPRGKRKTRQGVVISNKMDKSIVVQVTRQIMHPLFKKYIRRHKRYYAHDEQNTCRIGDIVQITETKPMSKKKRWRVAKIIERAA